MENGGVGVCIVGDMPLRLWGLDLGEWQRRAWEKAGAESVGPDGRLLVGADWILSPALQRALLARPGAALVLPDGRGERTRLAAIHVPERRSRASLDALINETDPDLNALREAGLTPGGISDFADAYDKVLRKREEPYAMSLRVHTPADIEKRQFKGSYKGVTDLVTKYVWPAPALHVTRWAANKRIAPNTVTTASLLLVIVAFYLFWIGAWWPGIVAAWGMTFLDTVDGKLARTTMTYSNWGNVYDHGIDLIHPPFWYWAIYHGLPQEADPVLQGFALDALCVILVGYVLNRLEELVFLRRFGFHIHVWKRIDSFAREITARRNPNMLIFTFAAMIGEPVWGFFAIAAWTVLWLVFHGVRLIQALVEHYPVRSWLET